MPKTIIKNNHFINPNNLLLHEAVNCADIGGWLMDADSGKMVWSGEAFKLLGLKKNELVSLPKMIRLFKKEAGSVLSNSFKTALEKGQAFDLELECTPKKGRAEWVHIKCKLKKSNRRITNLYGSLQDITKQKKEEMALRQGEEKYHSLIENSLNAFFFSSPDGIVFEVNKAAVEMLGYSYREFYNMDWRVFIDHTDPFLPSLLRKREREGKVAGELTCIRKSGEHFPCEFSSAIFTDSNGEKRTSTIITDISEKRKTEDEMELFMHNTIESFALIDKNYCIVTCNNAFGEGYFSFFNKEVKKGDSILDYTYPERREILKNAYKRVLGGETVESEVEIPDSDQMIHTFYNQFKPAYDKHKKIIGVFVTTIDITEKKKARQQLVENEKRFRALVENGNDAVAILSHEGKVTYVTPSVKKIIGYSEDELSGINVFSIIHPEDVTPITRVFQKALEKPGIAMAGYISKIKHKNGNWRWVEYTVTNMLHDPTIRGVVDNFRDVTEKLEAETRLARNEKQLSIAADIAKLGYWEFDVAEGLFTLTDQIFSIFKTTAEKSGGYIFSAERYAELFVHPEDRAIVGIEVENAINTTDPDFSRQIEHRVIFGNGDTGYISVHFYIIKDNQGNTIKTYGVNQDITERKQNEIAIRKLNEDLADSNTELQQFAYVVSHDLQEPLRMVSSFLKLLEKNYKNQLDETATKYIEYAVDGAGRMKKLIADLLEYSRVGTNREDRSETNIEKTVNSVLAIFVGSIEETNSIIKIQPLPVIQVNKTQIAQIFQNLIGNALKYNNSVIPEIEIGFEDKGAHWQFFVKDNGLGIDLQFFEKIFEPFQRINNDKNYISGTGIGLAISKKIAERHGGTIWVESIIGGGSCFFFTIKK